jgi:hypothetical protein
LQHIALAQTHVRSSPSENNEVWIEEVNSSGGRGTSLSLLLFHSVYRNRYPTALNRSDASYLSICLSFFLSSVFLLLSPFFQIRPAS